MKLLLVILCGIIFTIALGLATKPVVPTPKQHCCKFKCKPEKTRQAASTEEADLYEPVITIWGYD